MTIGFVFLHKYSNLTNLKDYFNFNYDRSQLWSCYFLQMEKRFIDKLSDIY